MARPRSPNPSANTRAKRRQRERDKGQSASLRLTRLLDDLGVNTNDPEEIARYVLDTLGSYPLPDGFTENEVLPMRLAQLEADRRARSFARKMRIAEFQEAHERLKVQAQKAPGNRSQKIGAAPQPED